MEGDNEAVPGDTGGVCARASSRASLGLVPPPLTTLWQVSLPCSSSYRPPARSLARSLAICASQPGGVCVGPVPGTIDYVRLSDLPTYLLRQVVNVLETRGRIARLDGRHVRIPHAMPPCQPLAPRTVPY